MNTPPLSDLAPHTASHDWEFDNITLTSSPPQYRARCRRCGEIRTGSENRFAAADCGGRVTHSPSGECRPETRYASPGDGDRRSGGEHVQRCPDGSWSKAFSRRCKLPYGHTGPHEYEMTGPRSVAAHTTKGAGVTDSDPQTARETLVEPGSVHETTGPVSDTGLAVTSLTGAATPLCARCQGDHLAADCPTLNAAGGPATFDADAEGTR